MTATTLAGEPIVATLTATPGDGAAIGGLQGDDGVGVVRGPAVGGEDVDKIYPESFRGPEHLAKVQEEARTLISNVLRRV